MKEGAGAAWMPREDVLVVIRHSNDKFWEKIRHSCDVTTSFRVNPRAQMSTGNGRVFSKEEMNAVQSKLPFGRQTKPHCCTFSSTRGDIGCGGGGRDGGFPPFFFANVRTSRSVERQILCEELAMAERDAAVYGTRAKRLEFENDHAHTKLRLIRGLAK